MAGLWAARRPLRGWHLPCNPRRAGTIRSCGVDRIRAVQQAAREFELPDAAGLVAAPEENLDAELPARVVLDAPLAVRARAGISHVQTVSDSGRLAGGLAASLAHRSAQR